MISGVLPASRVPVNILAWQLIGAAIFVPLYLMLELEQHSFSSERPVSQDPTVPYLQAKALLPATIITVLHLYRMVYFPPSGITTAQHQAWTAVWQLTPFLCYAAMAAIGLFLTSRNTEQVVESERSSNSDVPWLKAVFLLFGLFSAIGRGLILNFPKRIGNTSQTFELCFPVPKVIERPAWAFCLGL